MSEREGPTWPNEGKAVAAEVSERLRSILADAEAAAAAIRHEAEQEAQARRRAAETEALRIVEDARREAERFLADRIHRVSSLSDEILERGQSVVERLEAAEQVRADLASLVTALGETAARSANEVRALPGPRPPDIEPGPDAAWERAPEPPREEPRAIEPEPARDLAPEPEPEPIAEADTGLAEPRAPLAPAPEPPHEDAPAGASPLRPAAPVEPNPIQPAAAEAEPVEPDEAELLQRVLEAERNRSGEAAQGDGGEELEAESQEEDALEAEPDTPPAPEAEVDADAVVAADSTNGDAASAEAGDEPREVPSSDEALGARLVALQMAVAGGNRGEVESHLRRAFELTDPEPMLDDIFGEGTDSAHRVIWPQAG